MSSIFDKSSVVYLSWVLYFCGLKMSLERIEWVLTNVRLYAYILESFLSIVFDIGSRLINRKDI